MKTHTKCRMNEICRKPHRDGECERNCYYNTIEVKTNADKLCAKSDEELARFVIGEDFCELLCGSPPACDGCWSCEGKMLEWLKAPAEEGET